MSIVAEFQGIVSGKCPYWNECKNYTQDAYTCDQSHDEYGHRCYKDKEKQVSK